MRILFVLFWAFGTVFALGLKANEIQFSKYKIDGLRLTKVIRDNAGHARYFTPVEALQYCANIGGALPTARQYAELGIQLGAKGIRETAFPNKIHNLTPLLEMPFFATIIHQAKIRIKR